MKNTSLNTEQFWMTVHQKRYQKFAISVAIEMNKASKKRKAKKNTSKRQQKLGMGRIKTTFPTNMQVLQVWRTKGKL